MTHSVLVVEDDASLAAGLVGALRDAGYAVELATDGIAGARLALSGQFDLVVLDLMLPGQDGFEVLAQLRDRASTPVLVLTAQAELEDRLRCFGLGAADYLSKPFWTAELLARIAARLGKTTARPHRVVCWRAARLDLDARRLTIDGAAVELTTHEFNLLAALATRRGRAMSRNQLAELALPADGDRSQRTVDSHISRVRRKLGSAGADIQTVWGVGYRFEPAAC